MFEMVFSKRYNNFYRRNVCGDQRTITTSVNTNDMREPCQNSALCSNGFGLVVEILFDFVNSLDLLQIQRQIESECEKIS